VRTSSVSAALHPFHVPLEDVGCILVPAQVAPLPLGV